MKIEIKRQFPTNQEFNELFLSVGWGTRADERIDMNREKSVFALCAYIENQIVGMARVVGDGAYFTVYDVAVKTEFQNHGVGTLMMTEIVKWYESIQDDDTCLYLGAMEGKENFYEKFGFRARPYDGLGAGMKFDK